MDAESSTRFEKTTELTADSPTLIEGLPGLGMVASIAVDQITRQLGLEQHGTIVSDDLPPVASFDSGRVRDAVRVYAGADPPVMTLQSDVPIPPTAVESQRYSAEAHRLQPWEEARKLREAIHRPQQCRLPTLYKIINKE